MKVEIKCPKCEDSFIVDSDDKESCQCIKVMKYQFPEEEKNKFLENPEAQKVVADVVDRLRPHSWNSHTPSPFPEIKEARTIGMHWIIQKYTCALVGYRIPTQKTTGLAPWMNGLKN